MFPQLAIPSLAYRESKHDKNSTTTLPPVTPLGQCSAIALPPPTLLDRCAVKKLGHSRDLYSDHKLLNLQHS